MEALEVGPVAAEDLAGRDAPLRLLEAELRSGEPLPVEFVEALAGAVARGEADVISARKSGSGTVVGAALVYYRLNLASGGRFASFEELHVRPESRGSGVGRALLREIERRCSEKGIFYIEAQIISESESFFLASGYEPEPDLRVLSKSVAFGYSSDTA